MCVCTCMYTYINVQVMEEWGVADLLDEPYTLGSIRNVVMAHREKMKIMKLGSIDTKTATA